MKMIYVLQDHRTMLLWSVYTREIDCENRNVSSSRRNETIDKAAWTLGGRLVESSKPELQPPDKYDRHTLYYERPSLIK